MDDTYLYIRPIMRMCHLRYQVIGCGQQLKKFVQRLAYVMADFYHGLWQMRFRKQIIFAINAL